MGLFGFFLIKKNLREMAAELKRTREEGYDRNLRMSCIWQ